MKKVLIATIATSLLLTGCAKRIPPVKKEINNTFVSNLSYDKSWSKAVRVFAKHQIDIDTLEKDSGLIVAKYTQSYGANSGFMDCGKSARYEVLDSVNIKFNVFFDEKKENETEVMITATGQGVTYVTNAYGQKAPNTRKLVTCYSTGKFERDFFNMM
ncbi:hypothetical protein [Photobacterium sanguinicancri]|uniref:hypothetical protein n=1 Tax=Photobacterium sanguinicancri TaxID=875932 RepID=UPI0021C44C6B|nr:hypothetical protein [Photobacterium sanguinicancri]